MVAAAFAVALVPACKKKLFAKVHIRGRVADWYNNAPSPGKISVFSDNDKRQERYLLGTTYVDEQGNFDYSFPAAGTGLYFFHFPTGYSPYEVPIPDRTTYDFGLIPAAHAFICRVRLRYTSGLSTSVSFSNGPVISGPPGADSLLYLSQFMKPEEHAKSGGAFRLAYTVREGYIAKNHSVLVPLRGDTADAIVNF